MSIIVENEEPFELGTTVSSRIRLQDEDDNNTTADNSNGAEQVSLEVINPETGEVLRAEENMEALTDSQGDRYYLDSWTTSESLDAGEYYLVHRATVNEDPYKLTRIVELVEVKDDC